MNGSNYKEDNEKEERALINAARNGNLQRVRELPVLVQMMGPPNTADIDITEEDNGDNTALLWGSVNGHKKDLLHELLLCIYNDGALLNHQQHHGATALLLVCDHGHFGLRLWIVETYQCQCEYPKYIWWHPVDVR